MVILTKVSTIWDYQRGKEFIYGQTNNSMKVTFGKG